MFLILLFMKMIFVVLSDILDLFFIEVLMFVMVSVGVLFILFLIIMILLYCF